MKLLKTAFLSSLIAFVRICTGFWAGKIIAIFTGPEGVALVGQFANFITMSLTLGNGAINNGVVKYASEYEDDDEKSKLLFSTSLIITIICSLATGLILFYLSTVLSKWLFGSIFYKDLIQVFSFTVIFYSLNSLLLSILNGRKKIKTYTVANAAGSVIGFIFTIVLVYFYKIAGALYSLVLSQSIVFFVTAGLVVKSPWFSYEYFKNRFNNVMGSKLFRYSFMGVVSALSVPFFQILLRNLVINQFGVVSAGYWQGMMRISDGYLAIATTALGTYYLPKLSALNTDKELRYEIVNGYRVLLPIVFFGCIGIYIARFFIIRILFSPSFIDMESLFIYQLVGDFFKIAAYILAYLMLAKAMTKLFVITEIIFGFTYLAIGYLCSMRFGLDGITMAFAINYILYFLSMLFIFRKLVFVY